MKFLTFFDSEKRINQLGKNIIIDTKRLYRDLDSLGKDSESFSGYLNVKIVQVSGKANPFGYLVNFEYIQTYSKEYLITEFIKTKNNNILKILFKTKNFDSDDIEKIMANIKSKNVESLLLLASYENISAYNLEKIINITQNLNVLKRIVKNPVSNGDIIHKAYKRAIYINLTKEFLDFIIIGESRSKISKDTINLIVGDGDFYSYDRFMLESIMSLPQIDSKILNTIFNYCKGIQYRYGVLLELAYCEKSTHSIFKEIIEEVSYYSNEIEIYIAILNNEKADSQIVSLIVNKVISHLEFFSEEPEALKKILNVIVENKRLSVEDYKNLVEKIGKDEDGLFLLIGYFKLLDLSIISDLKKKIETSDDIGFIRNVVYLEKINLKNVINNQSECSELPKLNFEKEYLKILKGYLNSENLKIKLFILEELISIGYKFSYQINEEIDNDLSLSIDLVSSKKN